MYTVVPANVESVVKTAKFKVKYGIRMCISFEIDSSSTPKKNFIEYNNLKENVVINIFL